MSRVAYVNGQYLPHGQATVHIEDRGYQFADAVYEVWNVFDGRLGDYQGHVERLERSLNALGMPMPMTEASLRRVLSEVLRRNRVRDGILYLQVSRGTARRDHGFPVDTAPSVVVTAKALDLRKGEAMAAKGAAGITQPDIRWGRCDIKTVGLLPNVIAKQAALEAGAYECLFYDEMGLITEGASTNAWIVDEHGRLRTRDTQANILRGVTRTAVLALVAEEGLELDERPFSVEEAKQAREVFVTASSTFVMPLISLDGARIGDGRPGPIATRLREIYVAQTRRDAV